MSLALPGPSEDLEACSFDVTSLFKLQITPGQFVANSFPVGKKTPKRKKKRHQNYRQTNKNHQTNAVTNIKQSLNQYK